MKTYSVEQISGMFFCSKRSIYRWIKDGKINAEASDISHGCIKVWMIPESELPWIEKHSRCGRPLGSLNKKGKKDNTQKRTQK